MRAPFKLNCVVALKTFAVPVPLTLKFELVCCVVLLRMNAVVFVWTKFDADCPPKLSAFVALVALVALVAFAALVALTAFVAFVALSAFVAFKDRMA